MMSYTKWCRDIIYRLSQGFDGLVEENLVGKQHKSSQCENEYLLKRKVCVYQAKSRISLCNAQTFAGFVPIKKAVSLLLIQQSPQSDSQLPAQTPLYSQLL